MKFNLEFKFPALGDWTPVVFGPAPYVFASFDAAKREADELEKRGFATRILNGDVVVYDSTVAAE
jgi:hypothetical protein